MKHHVHIAGVIYATIFGFTFMFSKVALTYVIPIGLIAYRFLIAILVLEILRWFKVIHIRFEKKHFKHLFLVALFQPILYFLFKTFGIKLTTSGEAGMMIALIPIFVTILSSIILKEAPKKIQIFFILLSVSGVLFIQVMKSSSGLDVNLWGLLLLLGAVISAALFNIASRNASKTLKPYEITYFMMLGGAIVFNTMYLIQLAFESRITDYVMNLSHIELLVPILYLGVIASIGGFFLVNFALSKIPAHVSSIYANLSTIVAIIAGAWLLQEKLYYYHFIGALMIIIGVYGTVRFNMGIEKKKIKV
ncbi:MAG: EamA family transporter [Acholeplasmataceae bacterium]|nr:EamA family transporter [Acholeplasmataceae bacterium]MDD4194748.1 EamA family transporter [Acholeplasmataceae bacterium]